jgi:hypothetical protein
MSDSHGSSENQNRNADSEGQAREISDGNEDSWELDWRPLTLYCDKGFVNILCMS